MLLDDRARQHLDAMVDNFKKAALGVQRRYLVGLAMLENDQSLSIAQRGEMRQVLLKQRDDELQGVRIEAQKLLSSVRLYIATLGDDLSAVEDPGLDVNGLSQKERAHALELIERCKGVQVSMIPLNTEQQRGQK